MNLRILTPLILSTLLLFPVILKAADDLPDDSTQQNLLLGFSEKLAIFSGAGLLFTFSMVLLSINSPNKEFICPQGSFADNGCPDPCLVKGSQNDDCEMCSKAKCHASKNHTVITANPVPKRVYEDKWFKGNFIAMRVLTAIFTASISYPAYLCCKGSSTS